MAMQGDPFRTRNLRSISQSGTELKPSGSMRNVIFVSLHVEAIACIAGISVTGVKNSFLK